MPVGVSDYDRKLLTEGWKIGASADSFLPSEMNIGSVIRAQTMPSDYDRKLLTEGWKIGADSSTFLPETEVATTQEIFTPSGVQTFRTNDLEEAIRIQNEVRNKLAQEQMFFDTIRNRIGANLRY